MVDVTHVNPFLLAEDYVREELLLYLDAPLESGVVHALRTSEAPAMPALALAVVLGTVGTCGVHDATCRGANESASLPVGTRDVGDRAGVTLTKDFSDRWTVSSSLSANGTRPLSVSMQVGEA